MFREEVSVIDAIMAVALMESSMQDSAIILPSNIDILHTPFPEDPTSSYIELLTTVLTNLNLAEMLNKILEDLQRPPNKENDNAKVVPINSPIKTNSNFSEELNKNINNHSNIIDTSLSQIKRTLHNITIGEMKGDNVNKLSNKRKRLSEEEKDVASIMKPPQNIINHKNKPDNKRKNTTTKDNKKSKKDKINDLQLINMIPSVNDNFDVNDLNLDLDLEEFSFHPEKKSPCKATSSKMKNEQIEINNIQITPPKNVTQPVNESIKKTQNSVEKTLKENIQIPPLKNSTQTAESITRLQNLQKFAFKPRKVAPTKENEAASTKNENNDLESQKMPFSSKTMFQSDFDDIDFDFNF